MRVAGELQIKASARRNRICKVWLEDQQVGRTSPGQAGEHVVQRRVPLPNIVHPTDVERVARTFHGAHLVAQLRSSPLSNRPANHLRTGEVIVVAQHGEYPVADLQPAQSSRQRRDEPLRRESHEVASESYQVLLLFVYQPDDLL